MKEHIDKNKTFSGISHSNSNQDSLFVFQMKVSIKLINRLASSLLLIFFTLYHFKKLMAFSQKYIDHLQELTDSILLLSINSRLLSSKYSHNFLIFQ